MLTAKKAILLTMAITVTVMVSYHLNSLKVSFYHDYTETTHSSGTPADTPAFGAIRTGSSVAITTSTETQTFTSTVITKIATTSTSKEIPTTDPLMVNKVAGVWHSVMKRKVIVFSAYWDNRKTQNVPEIKVIAELNCKSEKKFFCKLYFAHNLTTMSEATVQLINSGCGQESDAHFIVCPIPNDLVGFHPTSLQIFANAKEPIGLIKVVPHLAINYPSTKIEHELAICVGRMYDYSDWLQLAFFIEFYKLMGATKFVFYTRSHTKDVETVLKYYETDGLIDVIPFPKAPDLDLVSSSDLERGTHVTFQLVQMTDCSYWLRGKAKFAANIDTDEFILPNANETLLELLEKNDVGQDWDGLLFRSRFYQLNWPHKLSLKQGDSVLQSFANLSKVVYPYSIPCPFGYRDKSVNKPNLIVRVSTHGIHESVKASPLLKQVDMDQAVIVHVRKMAPSEQPTKSNAQSNEGQFQCGSATDNVPAENPFAKHLEKLMDGVRKAIRDAKY